MEKNECDKVTIFDTLYTTNHIQILKILLPFLGGSMQKEMAVMIKMQELQYTIAFFNRKYAEINICSEEQEAFDMVDFLQNIMPYCSDSERKMFGQLKNVKSAMEMYKQMAPFMDMMNNMNADSSTEESNHSNQTDQSNNMNGFPFGGNNSSVMSEALKSFLTPEQQAMFEMFNMTTQTDSSATDNV